MSSPTKSKSPVTEPRQTRSARTQAKILAVVEKHLLAESFDEVSVQDLVNEAGCSVGAFYGRFSNKSAAVYHFYDTRCSELETLMEALLNPDRPESLAEIVDEFVATIVKRTFGYAAIIRSDALRIATGPDNPFTNRARYLNGRLLSLLWRCLDSRKSELTHRASQETALFVLAMAGGMSRDAVLTGARLVDSNGSINAARFTRELALAVGRYLGLPQS